MRQSLLVSLSLITLLCFAFRPYKQISHGVGIPADTVAQKRQWNIEGVTREALIYVPASARSKATPLIFVFHGHGGTMQNMDHKMQLQKLWPEAIIVYPQGLNTPGQLTDPDGKKPGWQNESGMLNDRDLKFFDAMLSDIKKDYKIDDRRIHVTGHSNGGGFTYLLWAERGDVFAAVAPAAATAKATYSGKLKPKPVFHLAGESDPLVKFAWQRLMMDKLLKLNSCSGEGTPYASASRLYASSTGNPVVLYIHPGGHAIPNGAQQDIVRFFKDNPKK